MSKRESIARYSLIIKKLRKQPSTFAEIETCLALESEIQAYSSTSQSAHFNGIGTIFVRCTILMPFRIIFSRFRGEALILQASGKFQNFWNI